MNHSRPLQSSVFTSQIRSGAGSGRWPQRTGRLGGAKVQPSGLQPTTALLGDCALCRSGHLEHFFPARAKNNIKQNVQWNVWGTMLLLKKRYICTACMYYY
eukprot:gene23596-biopygen7311